MTVSFTSSRGGTVCSRTNPHNTRSQIGTDRYRISDLYWGTKVEY